MARRGTEHHPNNTYFITFTVLGWKPLFVSERYCALVYRWFDHCKEAYGNRIEGYVIMPDHCHLLMYLTDRSPALPRLMMNAKRFLAYSLVELLEQDGRTDLLDYFAAGARTRAGAKHQLFTSGYDSLLIETRRFFLQKLNYIHDNPVRAGLVGETFDYLHSSAGSYINGSGRYPVDVVDF